jgi:phosphomevalonate kinase
MSTIEILSQKTPLGHSEKRKVFFICGKRLAGKDTFAEALSNLSTMPVKTFAFGDEIKRQVARDLSADVSSGYYGEDPEALFLRLKNDVKFKQLHRKAIVSKGDRTRGIDETYYTRVMAKLLLDNPKIINPSDISKVDNGDSSTLPVITDLRLLKEGKDLFGIDEVNNCFDPVFVRINATVETRIKRGYVYDPLIDDHPLEVEMDNYPYDFVVNNNSTIDDLTEKALLLLEWNDYPHRNL